MATWYNSGKTARANNPMYSVGKKLNTVHAQCPIDISEVADGDVWVLAGPVQLSARIHRIKVGTAFDLAAAADNDFGFYKMVNGSLVAIDADILVDGFNGTTGTGYAAGYDILSANTSLDRKKSVGELLSLQNDSGVDQIYLCMTMNTKETTADVVLDFDIEIEEATTI